MGFETTPLEYGYMASLSYANEGWDKQEKFIALKQKGWKPIVVGEYPDITPLRVSKSGYHGMVFANEARKEVVVAHRGTKCLKDLETDALAVAQNQVQSHVTDALTTSLNENVQALLREGYSLTFTGHSLGGFLATTSLYFCQRDDLGFHFPNSKAVVFDPAGSQDFIKLLEPHAESKHKLGDEGIAQLNVMHFVSLPNYVNSYAPHPGGTIYALSPSEVPLKTMNPAKYLLAAHSLDNILRCFVGLDDQSKLAGYPKEAQCHMMTDWPLIQLNELQSLGTVVGALTTIPKLFMDGLQLMAKPFGMRADRVAFSERLLGGEEFRRALAMGVEAAQKNGGQITVPVIRDRLRSHYVSKFSTLLSSIASCSLWQ